MHLFLTIHSTIRPLKLTLALSHSLHAPPPSLFIFDSMTHAEKQDGDFHGSMFNDLYDNTNWRLLGEKNTKGNIISTTLHSTLPGNNNAATKGDTVAAEYATCVDQTKNELNMCTSTAAHHCAQGGMAAREIGTTAIRAFAGRAATGLILGDAANKFDGVTKKNDEYETGTKNDGTASAPFGKQSRRYVRVIPIGTSYCGITCLSMCGDLE